MHSTEEFVDSVRSDFIMNIGDKAHNGTELKKLADQSRPTIVSEESGVSSRLKAEALVG